MAKTKKDNPKLHWRLLFWYFKGLIVPNQNFRTTLHEVTKFFIATWCYATWARRLAVQSCYWSLVHYTYCYCYSLFKSYLLLLFLLVLHLLGLKVMGLWSNIVIPLLVPCIWLYAILHPMAFLKGGELYA